MANEFNLYYRIINGNLRPHLHFFNKPEGLKVLKAEFYSREITVQKENIDTLFDGFIADFHGFKDGDELEVEVINDKESPQIIIRPIVNPDEEELINIDIPPPPDEKSEIFLRIIGGEYNRINSSFAKKLAAVTEESKLKLYVLKNIQLAKNLARDAHTLEKKLKKEGIDDLDNPNTYVVYILKKHLIYSLVKIQEYFDPAIAGEVKNEHELEDELFEFSHSNRMSRMSYFREYLNKKQIEKLYIEVGSESTIEDKLAFFKAKLSSQIEFINSERKRSSFGVTKHEYDKKDLYQKEFGKNLSEYYYQKLITESKEIGITSKYEELVKFVTTLKANPESMEYKALEISGFFDRMELEKGLYKDLLTISNVASIRENILEDLISSLMVLQTRKHLNLNENQMNDYLSDLLRAKQYYIADQSRSGRSGSNKSINYESGELDISIRDINQNGVIETIIETFELHSCGMKNIKVKEHIDKLLFRYDTAGNKENFIVIFAKSSNFIGLWEKYKNYAEKIVFSGNYTIEEINDIKFSKSDLKIGFNYFDRENIKLKLYHIFVNMKK